MNLPTDHEAAMTEMNQADALHTARLSLVPLTPAQLAWCADAPQRLEEVLGLRISRAVVTERVRRAIELKLKKMSGVEPARFPWYTYWLLVVRAERFGAGLAGFKGYPDRGGEAEVGYGIDPACQGQGYMTEALQALVAWAFREPACSAIIAPGTLKSNPASNRVLEKAGMHVYEVTAEAFSWRVTRQEFERRQACAGTSAI
jgi:[ribosomal protein S5]-alanine N-acetyltransferase